MLAAGRDVPGTGVIKLGQPHEIGDPIGARA